MLKDFKQNFLIKFWSPMPAIIALGVMAAYYFGLTGTYWAVTGEFTRWGGHILNLIGIDTNTWGYFKIIGLQGAPLDRIDGMMIIGMFAGALAAALMANNVKFRLPQSNIRIFQALIGGIIAGFGARIGMGCNLASFFTGIPQFSLHAWFFTSMTLAGVWVGTKIVFLPIFRSHIPLIKVSNIKEIENSKTKADFLFKLGILVLIVVGIWIAYLMFFGNISEGKKSQILAIAMLFGVGFGFVISRAQICFTSAFRDLFITGRGYMAKAVIIGMMVSTIGVFSYIMLGVAPKIMWAGPNAMIGGFLFGLGIVIAGGCECGWMYRAVEGQVHYWIVGIGNVIGATLLAATWDYYSQNLATNFARINLLENFGNYGGLILNYVLLFLFLILVLYIQRHCFLKNKHFKRI
ncbi:selenium metabolism membrane protein YedE/FdhT [Campylobacter cuniculorum]|uniref:Formate dehydrogenase biogenesis protein FdhT n=2 Tax=Campylobacter cuniculorum TaxID=374106 RepID=A0A1W6BX79_9BACT|nr:selenium metabolism membrane protein YedE/FdhT [Campylobacter cuniculorum]ARJ56678.1 formate dehydrogenase biogenesis protein FdhT [Campylobacter cuniculorum DSM 23162 = LMG 24588]QOR04151.1 selenium metabolism membrane protein YedE/FdhT [Campylobacter cuniculorum]